MLLVSTLNRRAAGEALLPSHTKMSQLIRTFQHLDHTEQALGVLSEAERAVRTIKSLLKKSGDPYLALMAYRATPLATARLSFSWVGG